LKCGSVEYLKNNIIIKVQKKNLIKSLINYIKYIRYLNFFYFFKFNFFRGLYFFIQILIGIFLAMYYSNDYLLAIEPTDDVTPELEQTTINRDLAFELKQNKEIKNEIKTQKPEEHKDENKTQETKETEPTFLTGVTVYFVYFVYAVIVVEVMLYVED
jgi:quinol-cytochrome oxidoreductase complex cytochrome b subunit